MKQLIIIGAGGMGRTFFDVIKNCIGYGTEYLIKGFIDDNIHALDDFENYPPLLGKISEYQPKEDDVFTCSMGGTAREICIKSILEKGGKMINIIHKTAEIGTNVTLGQGNFINAYSTIPADASLGDFNFLQRFVIVGHDVRIGSWNRLDSYVLLVGGTTVGNHVNVHTSAVINNDVVLGDRCKVAACSFVLLSVKEDKTVFGNPARVLR